MFETVSGPSYVCDSRTPDMDLRGYALNRHKRTLETPSSLGDAKRSTSSLNLGNELTEWAVHLRRLSGEPPIGQVLAETIPDTDLAIDDGIINYGARVYFLHNLDTSQLGDETVQHATRKRPLLRLFPRSGPPCEQTELEGSADGRHISDVPVVEAGQLCQRRCIVLGSSLCMKPSSARGEE